MPNHGRSFLVLNKQKDMSMFCKNSGSDKEEKKITVCTIFLVLVCLVAVSASCQKTPQWAADDNVKLGVYPDKHWQRAKTPEQFGWSSDKLAEARKYSKKVDTAAIMIVDDGVVIDAWGDITRNFQCHSMRKSLMSALIGVHVDEGNMNLSKTMETLNIDALEPSLSAQEKQATVADLIKARSGIYIPALGESAHMTATRPRRHSHPPGTFWYYNNWDFNALGTIFQQETETPIFKDFEKRFAVPLQMEDFDVKHCRYLSSADYENGPLSPHRYYLFRVSARDLARFGLLFLRQGRWRDRQIVSSAWVKESTASHSKIGPDTGYGYMWWTGSREGFFPNVKIKDHSYYAAGWGGHWIFVLPYRKLIIVHRVNTDRKGNLVSSTQMGRLLWHILDAAGETDIGEPPILDGAKGIHLAGDSLQQTLSDCTIKADSFTLRFQQDNSVKFWVKNELTDTGKWWVEGNTCWLKGKIITEGKKAGLDVVLDGDTIKWYDRDGTLSGKGIYTNEKPL
jgi:CubicO group peptidase (beta-lactamase class C family)